MANIFVLAAVVRVGRVRGSLPAIAVVGCYQSLLLMSLVLVLLLCRDYALTRWSRRTVADIAGWGVEGR